MTDFALENLDFEGPSAARLAHRRLAGEQPQRVFLVFGGRADQWWLRLLHPRFRHCFAVLVDAEGWIVLEPLSGRLLVQRLALASDFDLPAVYTRAGLAVLGPFAPSPARGGFLPPLLPMTCTAICRAVLGADAPFALTPAALFRRLQKNLRTRKKYFTSAGHPA